jgi:pimeloyl-ACP methyl ester carboxylesterase
MEGITKPELSYISLNSSPNATATIFLIHGAGSSPVEYKLVTPYVPAHYHILIPSLPGHGSSTHIKPFTLPLTCELLASLIRTRAKNSQAHIVGVSLGAHVALYLAAHYPDIVLTMFVSGYGRLPPPNKYVAPLLPYLVSGGRHVQNALPRSLVRYFMDGAEIDLEGTGVCNVQLCRDIIAVLCSTDEIAPVKARTLVVAATKRGVVPSNDSVEDAMMVGRIVMSKGGGNAESHVVEMKNMRHPWDMQAPQLFARCVVAWVEGRQLPEDMEGLEL